MVGFFLFDVFWGGLFLFVWVFFNYKRYCRARGFNVLFKATVSLLLIDFQKVEGSFRTGKCRISAEDLLRSKWGQTGRRARLVPVQIKFPAVRAQLNSCRKTPRVGTGSKRQQSLLPRHFSSSRACSAQHQLCIKHNLSFEAG